MSRLEAIAEELGMTTDETRQYTRAIRAHFEAAPGYAEILEAIRRHSGGRPSVEEVVAAVKQRQAERDAARAGKPTGNLLGGRREHTGGPPAERGRNPRSGGGGPPPPRRPQGRGRRDAG